MTPRLGIWCSILLSYGAVAKTRAHATRTLPISDPRARVNTISNCTGAATLFMMAAALSPACAGNAAFGGCGAGTKPLWQGRARGIGDMAAIRIEWVPVQLFGLGLLGFDHLQIVYQQDEYAGGRAQDQWFVMEGVREAAADGAFLGIEGADGRTPLSVANLAAREDLLAKIGTPDYRGSRCLPYAGDEFKAWETMASYARDIEHQDFPYIAYGLPGSPTPTINSSSAVASLIHYSGLDPSQRLPFGVHFSPGTDTLLGTGGDDVMRVEHDFATLLGGRGRDEFFGGSDRDRIEKFYGGEGDDLFHWSSGFNIIHGGQPQLDYAADGTDVIDYSGAGTVTITFNRHWVPHKVPQYVAVFDEASITSFPSSAFNGTRRPTTSRWAKASNRRGRQRARARHAREQHPERSPPPAARAQWILDP